MSFETAPPPFSYQSLGDPRYLPPKKLNLQPPANRRIYRPTPKQFRLPAPAFVAEGADLVSTNSAFKVRLGPSLAATNAVTVRLPGSNQVLRLQPVGLSLYDAASGSNALIAEIKADHPRLVFSNRVVFADCWDDVAADVVFVLNGRRGFAQNIVLKGPLPEPASFGLNPKTTRLQVWTEVFASPEPVKQERLLKEIAPGLPWKDEALSFSNKTRMIPGQAFLVGSLTNATLAPSPVAKRWQKLGDRTFLIEEMEYLPLAPELQKLPAPKKDGAALPANARIHHLASAGTQMPALPAVSTLLTLKPLNLSTRSGAPVSPVSPASSALILDYELTYFGYTDADDDGLPDEWELVFFGDIYAYNGSENPDEGGYYFDNYGEWYAGTHPYNSDTDGDGITDENDAAPLIPSTVTDTVWIEDSNSVPTNCLEGSWDWFDADNYPAPVSGLQAHGSLNISNATENTHGFTNHPSPLAVATGDVLVAYAYIPPAQVPQEIMLQWHATDATGWEHRAYWGTELLGFTNSYQMSYGFFDQGRWVRLEVNATNVALQGRSVDGMRFTIVGCETNGGEVLWDHIGVKHGATDSDGDGLPDWQEMQLGTDVNYPDSDYDGVSDGQEVTDETDPTNPASVTLRRLGYWRFNTANWVGEEGQWPWYTNYVSLAASWSSNALATERTLGSGLWYHEYRTNGAPNINCLNGTVRLWFKPAWAGTNAGGNGPGVHSRLIEVGAYVWPPLGHWAFGFNPEGTRLWFVGMATNTSRYAWIDVPIHFQSNVWHQIAVTYTPTNSALYVDGQVAGTGGGIDLLSAARRSPGFEVGVDAYGAWSYGQFEELETFNYPLSSTTLANAYQQAILAYDHDGDGLTGQQEADLGTDPLKPSILNTNNLYNLRVYTPLK